MNRTIWTALALVASTFAPGCGPAAGTEPHAMSAAEHQAAAEQERNAGGLHGEQYDPGAATPKRSCVASRGGACWKSSDNPTQEHKQEAEHHRELAAKHRAASEALRSAEVRACAGIPEDDRDMSPFAHRDDIRSVAPLRVEMNTGKASSFRMGGATVVFAAVPGMTAEWLQRVVDCHLARNAAVGHDVASADMAHCPLTPPGVKATVESVGDGFAVRIQADDQATSDEILRRAQSLKGAS
jgi:hypothetical protein